MPTSDYLINLENRRQVILERFKAGEARQFQSLLRDIAKDIRARLQEGDLTEFNRRRQIALLADVNELLTAGLGKATGQLKNNLLASAVDEAEFSSEALNKVISGFDSVLPTPDQIRAAVLSAPLSVRGPNGGKLLEPWIKDWSKFQITQVDGAIRRGFFEGQTNQQMINSVVGS
ncbi:MAG: phage head morphogenesis protein, partial [Gammaproteobacteria bacterium]|nr:phage head morphogenesis protein [Gammaproteobacteria bacterium]